MEQQEIVDLVPRGQFIGGHWVSTDQTLDVVDPATEEVIAQVSDATPDNTKAALDAAEQAAEEWRTTSPRERAELLRRTYELIMDREETFATLMTLEMGKPYAEAVGEVSYGAEFFRWFSEEASRIEGRWSSSPEGTSRLLVMHQPVGLVYAITPWNFPLSMGTRKIAPALAAGCTVVMKPAQLTPLTMLYLMHTMQDAGLPEGVVNCLVSSSAGDVSMPVFADERVRKLSFTGSTEVGRSLLEQASQRVLRTSMELGGNAPFLLLSDGDVDAAVQGSMKAKFRNNGQACTAANRFFVHASLVEEFSQKLAKAADDLVLGPGIDKQTTLGPLVEQKQVDKVSELVDDAVAKGAKVLTGGKRPERPGFFYEATVLAEVPDDARVMSEEIFGPVAPIISVASDEEALRRANEVEFGLMAYVYSRDITNALRAAEAIESGIVAVNSGLASNAAAPFGGMKQSGLGREGSHEGIAEYLETKYIALPMP